MIYAVIIVLLFLWLRAEHLLRKCRVRLGNVEIELNDYSEYAHPILCWYQSINPHAYPNNSWKCGCKSNF